AEHAGVRGQLRKVLRQYAQPDRRAAHHVRAGEGTKESGLSGSVGADDPDTVARPDQPRDVVEDGTAAEAHGNAVELEDLASAPRTRPRTRVPSRPPPPRWWCTRRRGTTGRG